MCKLLKQSIEGLDSRQRPWISRIQKQAVEGLDLGQNCANSVSAFCYENIASLSTFLKIRNKNHKYFLSICGKGTRLALIISLSGINGKMRCMLTIASWCIPVVGGGALILRNLPNR